MCVYECVRMERGEGGCMCVYEYVRSCIRTYVCAFTMYIHFVTPQAHTLILISK